MPQSLASIHLHVVFSTKNRAPWLADPVALRLYDYVGGTLRANGCALVAAGGVPDHVHLLISVGRERATADLVRTVKANSSRWVHDTFADLGGFAWQAGYGAFAVSYDRIDSVRAYLARQQEHHRTRTFQDEFRAFLRAHDMEWDERFVWN